MGAFKDLTGVRFGMLAVIKWWGTDKGGGSKWLCQCDCGGQTIANGGNLKKGHSLSCGCLKKQLFAYKLIPNNKENTQISHINPTYFRSDNTSGTRGVCWDKCGNKWKAEITLQGRKHNLGYFTDINDAIAARKAAEEKYFKPILDKYKEASG